MAIIVEDKTTLIRYFLLGTGLGVYKTSRPSFLGGNLLPHEEVGEVYAVAVCDENGEIDFVESKNLKVISIDGVSLADLSSNLNNKDIINYEVCPGCNSKVKVGAKECKYCGLRLQ